MRLSQEFGKQSSLSLSWSNDMPLKKEPGSQPHGAHHSSDRLLSQLKETRVASALRYRFWRKVAEREHSYVEALGEKTKSEVPNFKKFGRDKARPPGSKLFILGNGSSINELDPPAWQEISRHLSVGLNAWPLHPFVPNYFSFEFAADTVDLNSELKRLVERAEKSSRKQASNALFLRPPSHASPSLLTWLASVFPNRKQIYGRSNLGSRDPRNIAPDLRKILLALKAELAPLSVLPDNGSSVARLICAGLLGGYSEIVLSGVDLNDRPYFWFEDDFITSHGDFREMCPRGTGGGVQTLSKESRPFSTKDFIAQLDEVARSDFGATICVTSENSSLYPLLELYSF